VTSVYGVIFFWRVKPDKLAEHEAVLKEVLRIERERCPEVLSGRRSQSGHRVARRGIMARPCSSSSHYSQPRSRLSSAAAPIWSPRTSSCGSNSPS
jgi:hypothetical protein